MSKGICARINMNTLCRHRTHLASGLRRAGKEAFSRLLPLYFPTPSLFNTSRTSLGELFIVLLWERDRVRSGRSSKRVEVAVGGSKVRIDEGRAEFSAMFDMLPRPSSASRRS